MKLSLILCLCFGYIFTEAQTQAYTYAKQNKVITLTNKLDSIVFSEYKKIDRKTSERNVTINGALYKFVNKRTKHGSVKDITDVSGNKLATVFLDGVNINNIILPDGKQLKWQRTGKTSWGYFVNDKEVVKSFYYFHEKAKNFVVQKNDSTLNSLVLPAISLEYGTGNSKNTAPQKRTVGTMFAIAGMMAVVRVLMNSDTED